MQSGKHQQFPTGGTQLLRHAGDVFEATLRVEGAGGGRAILRSNIGQAALRRRDLVSHIEQETPRIENDWRDIPMQRIAPSLFKARVPLLETGRFEAKACFIPRGAAHPEWPAGDNIAIKVEPAHTVAANTVYCAFARLFRSDPHEKSSAQGVSADPGEIARLDSLGYSVIPPSGTLRGLMDRLDHILGDLGFRWIQLLPIHPVPTTFARMGRFGSPFAALDYLAVDPALASFEHASTPLDQFREFIDEVHARGARVFMDIPVNHTGWASTLQNHHPEWFAHENGDFVSPGAWGIVWEDLVKLDYSRRNLWNFMAEVFVFWCAQGVDGFRCDAGYMIPEDAWTYIVARVRTEYPDTVFLLENLGGRWEVTERLLEEANLDWAYSEIFQFENRADFERELPKAIALSERLGPLVHYAETHDNQRLASRGPRHARLRTGIAALFSQQGAFGITCGAEWFAGEKIDVHALTDMNWGAKDNQVDWIRRLNGLLASDPGFGPLARLRLVQQGGNNTLALLREAGEYRRLVLANLDADAPRTVRWEDVGLDPSGLVDLLSNSPPEIHAPDKHDPHFRCTLPPAGLFCLAEDGTAMPNDAPTQEGRDPSRVLHQRLRLAALRIRGWITGATELPEDLNPDTAAGELERDPEAYCRTLAAPGLLPSVRWRWPEDRRRRVMIPPGHMVHISAPSAFQAELRCAEGRMLGESTWSLPAAGEHHAFLAPSPPPAAAARPAFLIFSRNNGASERRVSSPILLLPNGDSVRTSLDVDGDRVRKGDLLALLTNGRGGMGQVRARWGELRSQYDALLAANLHPRIPDDRVVVFTRCRGWVVHHGFSSAIDADRIRRFRVDPSGSSAQWEFSMQAGMGRSIPMILRLDMPRGCNRIVLTLERPVADAEDGAALDDSEPVEIILRPDIEWRNFHAKTKAFTGPEEAWPSAVVPRERGFTFQPEGSRFVLESDAGAFHSEPEWLYMVEHPEDAERGLEGTSDLFSPGFFRVFLAGGARFRLAGEIVEEPGRMPPKPDPTPSPAQPLSVLNVLTSAMDAFLVRREQGWTVVAGYPWFLDWGRDTLIFLRGLLSAGREAEVLHTLAEFARLEKQGTLPNMLRGEEVSNRETSDAPLWFIIAVRDLCEQGRGGQAVLETPCGTRTLREVVASILRQYRAGVPNGIRCDEKSGLVFSPAHFTWMDTNHPAGTPRRGYPIEIQALWHQALLFGRKILDTPELEEVAERVAAGIEQRFFLPEEGYFADCLLASPGESPNTATPDRALRCNQILAMALGAVRNRNQFMSAMHACEPLLVPGGLRSLADRPVSPPLRISLNGRLLGDPGRPYRGHYLGDEDTERKPAYHNGTAWAWVFPSYVEAVLDLYGKTAFGTAAAWLGSVAELLGDGCLGQVPEILDGDSPHARRGCAAQAWSASEYVRVWNKLRQAEKQEDSHCICRRSTVYSTR